jgi:cytochrome c oxidase subunit I+III
MVVLMLVDGTVCASLLFSYFYLWTVTPGAWPPAGHALPALSSAAAAASLWLASSAALSWANHLLGRHASRGALALAVCVALACAVAALGIQWQGHAQTGLDPTAHAYGAAIYAALAYQALHVAVIAIMGAYTLARSFRGLLDSGRRITFDNTRLLWQYTVGQGVVIIAATQVLPRLAG